MGHTRLVQRIIVLPRNNPTGYNQDVFSVPPFQLRYQLGHQGFVPTSQGADAHNVHVILYSLARGFFRRLE